MDDKEYIKILKHQNLLLSEKLVELRGKLKSMPRNTTDLYSLEDVNIAIDIAFRNGESWAHTYDNSFPASSHIIRYENTKKEVMERIRH